MEKLASLIFSLANHFRNHYQLTEFNLFQEKAINGFTRLEKKGLELQLPPSSVQHVKYALSAFLDEIVMSSQWEHRHQWMANPLQLQFFGEHLAGEGFYKRLSQIRQQGSGHVDVLEVYYLCLELGFEGMYRRESMEKLMALKVELRNQIEGARGKFDPRLSPEGLPKTNIIKEVSRDVPLWVVGSVTAGLLCVIYLGFSVAIERQSHHILKALKQQYQHLLHHQSSSDYEDDFS